MLNEKDLDERIRAANEMFVDGEDAPNAPQQEEVPAIEEEAVQPTDLYREEEKARYKEQTKNHPNGSSQMVKAVVKSVVQGDGYAEGLARSYRRAKDDSDMLKGRGERSRAEMVRQQYMEEKFLPAVESVIAYSSPDELLNCKDALSTLDEFALGVGAMNGYTASYVRQAYKDKLGNVIGNSDPTVADAVRRIKMLVDDDQYRTAIGLAEKLKKSIDEGNNLASDDDYALLGRIVAYAN